MKSKDTIRWWAIQATHYIVKNREGAFVITLLILRAPDKLWNYFIVNREL